MICNPLCIHDNNDNDDHNYNEVFFRAGVLGQMEEFRDERLGKIMSWMQAWARGYLARKGFKKLQEQRVALKVVQRNLRKYMQLRTWPCSVL
uniref:Myosin motor domain-containing protein n=1 Tax=Glossina austeni TaxID=7395 RepID=A0A1A9VH40_GLOAU